MCPLEWLVGSGLVVQLRPFDVISTAGATSSILALLSDGQEKNVSPLLCLLCGKLETLLDFILFISIALVASVADCHRVQDGKEI